MMTKTKTKKKDQVPPELVDLDFEPQCACVWGERRCNGRAEFLTHYVDMKQCATSQVICKDCVSLLRYDSRLIRVVKDAR